jgi:hypothetical protein
MVLLLPQRRRTTPAHSVKVKLGSGWFTCCRPGHAVATVPLKEAISLIDDQGMAKLDAEPGGNYFCRPSQPNR